MEPPKAACPTAWSPASAAARTPWACSTRSSTTATIRIIGVEAGGHGVDERMEHAASLTGGRPGVLHGNRTYLLQDEDGQILEGHSISAGLDYPGIGPEHAWLHDMGRVEYVSLSPMTRRSTPSSSAAGPRASSPRSNPATRWPMWPSASRRTLPKPTT